MRLTEALRTGANRLNADLQLLEGNLGEVRDAVVPARFEAEASEPAASSAPPEPEAPADKSPVFEDAATPGEDAASGGDAATETAAADTPPADTSAAADTEIEEHGSRWRPHAAADGETAADTAGPTADSDDTEGARLIALNMALNGTPREETERYLAENFQLADRNALLDEVYASVGG